MSVSGDVKKTILESQYKSACCRRALLLGVLSSKGIQDQDGKIFLTLEKEEQLSLSAP